MKDFLAFLLNQILTKPEALEIAESEQNGVTSYTIKVSEEDMGLIIGKEGRTIKSIRNLTKAKAIRDGIRVNVELKDDKLFQN